MADLESELTPVAESLLDPGEELRGACVASQQSTFRGWMVAIVVTDDRLVLQKLTRKFDPDGEPTVLTPERIRDAKLVGGSGMSASIEAAMMDEIASMLVIRTTDGEKLKLRMMNADGSGLLRWAGGGEIQRQGVIALGEWLDRSG